MNKQNQFDTQKQNSQKGLPQDWRDGLRDSIYLSELVEQRGHLLLPLLGYGFLGLSLFDYVYILMSPRFTNPFWELQTIGALVEHVVAPLLGLMFIFYRHEGHIGKLEKSLLGFLSWVSLIIGLLYLLMLPLGSFDTWRIYHYNSAQVSAQVSQGSQQIQQLKGQLNQAKTDEQIKKLIASLTPKGRLAEIKTPQTVKGQLLAEISQTEQSIRAEADRVQTNKNQTLLKNSVKWHLGALLSGTLFIWIWRLTDWTRIRL